MKVAAILLPLAIPLGAFAAIQGLQVSGATATQALISYIAPSDQPCTVEVSESPTFHPVVVDFDEYLFPGSSSDARPGSLSDGNNRLLVIGKHGMMAPGTGNPFIGSDGNRYSRALRANAAHYFRISCGADQVTGQFQTSNIYPGTYSEPLPAEGSGTYNYPTVKTTGDRSESWIDPNTGSLIRRVTVPDDADAPIGKFTWPTGGMFQLCSHSTTVRAGHTYVLCAISGSSALLVSIETDTGNVFPLTRIGVPYGASTCTRNAWAPVTEAYFSRDDALGFYFVSNCLLTGGRSDNVAWFGRWTGPLNTATPSSSLRWPGLWQSGLQTTLLTPNGLRALLAAFDARFTPDMSAKLPVLRASGTQNGHLVFYLAQQQDSLGWIFVLDPGNNAPVERGGTAKVLASNNFWAAPVSRWCSIHTLDVAGDWNPWVSVVSNSLGTKYSGLWGGPYYLTAAEASGSSSTIKLAPNAGSYEPYSPSSPEYLQDLAVGDQIHIGDPQNGEHAEVLSIDRDNHSVTLIRGDSLSQSIFVRGSSVQPIKESLVNVASGTKLYMGCRAVSLSNRVGQNGGRWYWNYLADPFGASISYPAANGSDSNQVVENYVYGGHIVTRDAVNVMGGYYRWEYSGATPGFDLVSSSDSFNGTPPFAGQGLSPLASGHQSHPSYENLAAQYPEWFVDSVPMTNDDGTGRPYRANATLLSGTNQVYQLSGLSLHRKHLTTLASCGSRPLRDISGASKGSMIDDSLLYTYCVAESANECQPGSTAGNVYVNCPAVSVTTCAAGPVSGSMVDICVGDSHAYTASAIQVRTARSANDRGATRTITNAFMTHHAESIFSSVRPTPDGSWLLFASTNPTGNLQIYMASIPPLPAAPSSHWRDRFVPVVVKADSTTGADNVIVEFGYAENGDPSNLFCTTRRETCVAQRGTIREQQAFFYAETEASLIVGQPLVRAVPSRGGGLVQPVNPSIVIPALPGRIVYYRVVYRNKDGSIAKRDPIAARAVP